MPPFVSSRLAYDTPSRPQQSPLSATSGSNVAPLPFEPLMCSISASMPPFATTVAVMCTSGPKTPSTCVPIRPRPVDEAHRRPCIDDGVRSKRVLTREVVPERARGVHFLVVVVPRPEATPLFEKSHRSTRSSPCSRHSLIASPVLRQHSPSGRHCHRVSARPTEVRAPLTVIVRSRLNQVNGCAHEESPTESTRTRTHQFRLSAVGKPSCSSNGHLQSHVA